MQRRQQTRREANRRYRRAEQGRAKHRESCKAYRLRKKERAAVEALVVAPTRPDKVASNRPPQRAREGDTSCSKSRLERKIPCQRPGCVVDWIIDPRLNTDGDGVVRIGESRVSLASFIAEFHRGATPEQIVQNFDAVSLEDAYAVVAYYLKNQVRLDALLASERRENDRIQQEAEARFPQSGIRERLLARRNGQQQAT